MNVGRAGCKDNICEKHSPKAGREPGASTLMEVQRSILVGQLNVWFICI